MAKQTVLIVDDSPTENRQVCAILKQAGYEVISAESGEDGLKLAREQHPDLVVMDVVMPGLNGFQATRQLGRDSATADIPVVILSSKGQETDRLWGERQGAKGYLVKPVDGKLLLKTIKQILGNR